jgi:uncharacterized Ntn-hydrolase superfamily protein
VTYSIVARDPATGELGVAVQSHWFSVGSTVPWAEPAVGAVATQSIADPSYGPNALDLLREGGRAREVLSELVRRDPGSAMRQVAVVDSSGEVAVHTGRRCVQFAGHETGRGFVCAANMMRDEGVPQAMARAFTTALGDLPDRLLVALDAAEAAGGDVRGRQSAAIAVAPREGEPWRLTTDLRVEDHPEPLDELERLLDVADAYRLATEGDNLVGRGDHDAAAARYTRAAQLAPGNHELIFWSGLSAAEGGDMTTAVERVRRAIELQPGWAELLDRLEPDIAPSAAAVRAALREAG